MGVIALLKLNHSFLWKLDYTIKFYTLYNVGNEFKIPKKHKK
jgi:hypothetical protein